MSSVTTTLINTANGATPLTLASGNTTGPSIIVGTTSNLTLKANSTVNTAIVNTTSFTTSVPLVVSNNVTAGAIVVGTNDVSREIQLSGSLAVVGYDGIDAFVEGGAGKGVSLYVNASSKALDIDPTQNATFSNNLIVTKNITSANLTANSMLLGNSSISAVGYTTLPNGLKLQWGTAAITTAITTVTFAEPFNAVAYSVVITPTTLNKAWVVSSNTTAFTADTDVNQTINFMAIGV